MHHLINELRPHQARESIRVSLQVQKKQRIETTLRLSKQIERVQEMIKTATQSIKDKDISALLQETLPENFDHPSRPPEKVDECESSPSITNGHEQSHRSGPSLLSKLDAFMCDLVDESF